METRSLNANCSPFHEHLAPSGSRNINRYRLGLRARICFVVQDKKVSAYQPHSAEGATFNSTISILCFNLFKSHKLIREEMRHKFDFSMQQFFSPFRQTFCVVSLFLCICFTFYITVAICLPDYLLQIQFPVAVQPCHPIFNPSYQLSYKPDAKNFFQINTEVSERVNMKVAHLENNRC